jgi:hypothetical protein
LILVEGRAWLVTDRARRLAIARRLDGKPWEYRNGEFVKDPSDRSKTKNLYGSQGNWPIGVLESESFPAIALCEGAPDFLSVFQLALSAGITAKVAPICMSGAACHIHAEALPMFRGKRVRIFGHADEAGQRATRVWAEQLSRVQAEIDGFGFYGLFKCGGSPVKDLNDFLLVDSQASDCTAEILDGVMDFALERRG